MKEKTIVITGATGGVGGRTARHLSEHPELRVVAAVRDPDSPRLPQIPGLEARRADYDLPETLVAAFHGADRLVFVSSDGDRDDMARHHRHVVDAAVGHIVYTSILDVDPVSPFYFSGVHRETENLIAGSGIPATIARTSVFSDFFRDQWLDHATERGTLAVPAGAGRISLVCRDDVARGLAALAILDTPPARASLTGPRALAMEEIAAAASADYAPPDPETYRASLVEGGSPDWLVAAYTSMFATIRLGAFATVSSDIDTLTGRAPRSLEDWLAGTA